jgi:hypothetical protein
VVGGLGPCCAMAQADTAVPACVCLTRLPWCLWCAQAGPGSVCCRVRPGPRSPRLLLPLLLTLHPEWGTGARSWCS